MKKVYQTTFGGAFETTRKERGDCHSACVATYLGLNIEDVPRFIDWDYPEERQQEYIKFMHKYGFHPLNLSFNDSPKENIDGIIHHSGPALVFVSIESGKEGYFHMVIFKDGELWHDPGMKELDPSLDRYKKITHIDFILPLNANKEPQ